MRKTLYIVTMVLGMFGFSSCSDYLDKESDTELDLKICLLYTSDAADE